MTGFLVDASLPRDTAAVIRSCGYAATDVRDIGLGMAPDREIARRAHADRLCLITRDYGFGDVREYPPPEYDGVVVISAPQNAGRDVVFGMLRSFLEATQVIEHIAGRLAVVEPGRIRVRG